MVKNQALACPALTTGGIRTLAQQANGQRGFPLEPQLGQEGGLRERPRQWVEIPRGQASRKPIPGPAPSHLCPLPPPPRRPVSLWGLDGTGDSTVAEPGLSWPRPIVGLASRHRPSHWVVPSSCAATHTWKPTQSPGGLVQTRTHSPPPGFCSAALWTLSRASCSPGRAPAASRPPGPAFAAWLPAIGGKVLSSSACALPGPGNPAQLPLTSWITVHLIGCSAALVNSTPLLWLQVRSWMLGPPVNS